MSDAQAERTPGPQEQAVLDLFEEEGWRSVSLEQTGPDGTQVLAMLIFHICPQCSACIPLGTRENPFPDEHFEFHRSEAQATDEVVEALRFLLPSSPE